MALKHYSLQLRDANLGTAIIASGGKVQVNKPGSPDKSAVVDKNGLAVTNPITPVRGKIDFYVDDVLNPTVDLYIQAPGGQFVQLYAVVASGDNEININTNERNQFAVIPFSIADAVANVEQATGFTVPANAAVLPAPLARVTTLEAARTLLLGTLSSASGVAAGFINGVSLAAATLVKASNLNGSQTMGSLLFVQDSANAGDRAPEADVTSAGKQISYTLSASTVAAKGFATIPMLLAA